VTQPLLFCTQESYGIKADHTAIALPECSCFVEAVEYLFMAFFSFGIHYPVELKIFYGFLEHLMGLEPSVKSVVLADRIRSVSRIDAYSSAMQCEDG